MIVAHAGSVAVFSIVLRPDVLVSYKSFKNLHKRKMLSLGLSVVLLSIPAILCRETKTTCNCIKPDNDTSSSECLPLSNYVTNTSVILDNSCFCFLPGEYYLQQVWQILPNRTLYNLSLVAPCINGSYQYSGVASVTCTGNHSGLVFENVTGLAIAGLKFTNCGHVFNYSKLVENISSSLLLIHVQDLSMTGVEIHDSNGWGMYCFSLLGNSVITHTLISGGHYITNHNGGNLRFKYEGDFSYENVSNVTVSHTVIKNGAENFSDSHAYAGGIDIYLITKNRINVYFNYVTFHNNSGYDGGNIAISYTTRADGWNSTVIFTNCTISAGYAAHDGGGLYMEVIQKTNYSSEVFPVGTPNSVIIISVFGTNFTDNTANEGAGLFLEIHESQFLSTTAKLHFISCNFINNSANRSQSGTAVHVVNYNLPGSVQHRTYQYYVTFDKCAFERNGKVIGNVEHLLGCGTMYVAENAMTVIKNSTFTNNNCSGLVAVQSSIVMEGSVVIEKNTGYNGAGIMLCANSKLFVTKETNITVEENRALNFGGGIYAEFECSQAVPPCFYGTQENNTQVYLVNNNASTAGDALYGGSIDDCYTSPNSLLVNNHRVEFDTLFQIIQSNTTKSKITSDPYNVFFCSNSTYNQSYCITTYNYSDTALYAGMVIHVYVVLAGQRNGAVPGVVKASFGTNHTINSSQETQSVNSTESCTKLEYDVISPYLSDLDYTDIILLSVGNAYFRTSSPNQEFHSTLNLAISQCPHGFKLSNGRCTCSSALNDNLKNIACTIQNQSVTRDINVNWWLGLHNGSVVYSVFCPFDFCQNMRRVTLSLTSNSGHDKQCAFNRSGTLCGSCPHPNSTIFGSSRCRDCQSHSPLRTFGLTVLFAFAGILLLVLLGVLNLNVTEGPLNPIIFYMNVVRLNDSVFFGYGGDRVAVHDYLQVFVSWMNLDLGIDTCYYDGMGTIGKTSLQFVFPFYLWFLCGLLIYLSRHYSLVSRIAGNGSVRLLATVILLSYTKILKNVIDIVWPTTISRVIENGFVHHQTLWKMDGQSYFRKDHNILCIIAVVVAICTLPYTLSLLFIQCLNKRSHYKVLFWVIKLKPFFDAYTGPYKDGYHFWTGFLLVVRFILFIAIACNTTNGPMLNMTLVCGTAAILFLLSRCGVYKVRFLCFIESFVYFNLILFSIGTVYVFQEKETSKQFYYSNSKGVIICVGSMFLLFCGVIAFNIAALVIQTQCWRNLKVWLLERQWIVWKRKTPIRSLILQHSVTDSSSSSSDDEMDPILENAPPVARYDQLREPLVETH